MEGPCGVLFSPNAQRDWNPAPVLPSAQLEAATYRSPREWPDRRGHAMEGIERGEGVGDRSLLTSISMDARCKQTNIPRDWLEWRTGLIESN